MAERRCGIVQDPRFLAHRNGTGAIGSLPPPDWLPVVAFERPERLEALATALSGSGVLGALVPVPAREANDDDLLLAHAPAHVAAVRELAGAVDAEPLPVGDEAWVGPGTWTAAMLGAGSMIACVDAVLDARLDSAYVAARPPGHHATGSAAMGFCLFNAVAIGARHAQRRRGAGRVAIVDWDVHHGNGTQAIFEGDRDVLFVSIHQDGLYPPGSGRLDERGAGTTVNIPLPDGCGDAAYVRVLDEIVVPRVRAFAPELLLISAGQDAAAADPLGRMAMTTTGYRAMADMLVGVAGEVCDGRVVAFHEGGYDVVHAAACTLAAIEGLAGLPATFETDPVGCDVPDAVGAAAAAAIASAREVHGAP